MNVNGLSSDVNTFTRSHVPSLINY